MRQVAADTPGGGSNGTEQHGDSTRTEPRPTALREVHQALGATLTGFAGWLMPLRYGSETAEHNAVRSAAGMFDLSHMGQIGVRGPQAADALDYALVGNLSRVTVGRARYTMMCAEDGGVMDDLIVYRLDADEYPAEFLVVANASNADTVRAALRERSKGYDAEITGSPAAGSAAAGGDQALIAVQGPRSASIVGRLTDAPLAELKYYASVPATLGAGPSGTGGLPVLLARTGYTGEDGFELFCRPGDAVTIWEALTEAGKEDGLIPAGLSARDTLRLEAGMPLYGNELGRDTTPFEAGLGRVVKFDKPGDFVGRDALAARAHERPARTLIGLEGRSRRVPRHGYPVLLDGRPCGTVTSGAPSPSLGRPIAMAYVDPLAADAITAGTPGAPAGANAPGGSATGPPGLAVDIRGRAEPADYVKPPFYHRDK
jgi:aminomethyltransferase